LVSTCKELLLVVVLVLSRNFLGESSVSSDDLGQSSGLLLDLLEMSDLFSDQGSKGFKSALSVSGDWSAEFSWWWNNLTLEHLVQVVDRLEAWWGIVVDVLDDALGSDQLLVDLSNQNGLSVNLSNQSVDEMVDLLSLLVKDSLLVDQLVDVDSELSDSLDVGLDNNDASWSALEDVALVHDVSGDSSDVDNVVSDLSDVLSDDVNLLLNVDLLDLSGGLDNLLSEDVDLLVEDEDLLLELHDLGEVLSDGDVQLLVGDLLGWLVETRQVWLGQLVDSSSDESDSLEA